VLCPAGADVHSVDGDGNTPLHFAVEMGHAPVAKLLMRRGADQTRANKKGKSAASMAEAVRSIALACLDVYYLHCQPLIAACWLGGRLNGTQKDFLPSCGHSRASFGARGYS
jgi:ankyrin repeat protein